jgi:hypothetical protein
MNCADFYLAAKEFVFAPQNLPLVNILELFTRQYSDGAQPLTQFDITSNNNRVKKLSYHKLKFSSYKFRHRATV